MIGSIHRGGSSTSADFITTLTGIVGAYALPKPFTIGTRTDRFTETHSEPRTSAVLPPGRQTRSLLCPVHPIIKLISSDTDCNIYLRCERLVAIYSLRFTRCLLELISEVTLSKFTDQDTNLTDSYDAHMRCSRSVSPTCLIGPYWH